MSFDISRLTFNSWNDFSGVVMQQGRVQLDSDWNEWLGELARRIRAGTLDTLGRAVYPSTTPGAFQILIPAANQVTIGVGRMYVDGLLVENHGLPAPSSGGWIPPSVSTSNPQPTWDPALDELVGSAINFNQQPYYPGAALPGTAGLYVAYLDVWQREVTFLEDPDLIEKAVGVDTTGRIQTVWQVRLLDVSSISGGVTCSTPEKDYPWPPTLPSGGLLTIGVVQSSPSGPCCLTANTGYTGMENQLYRVEIHVGGSASSTPAANFKWSRDNASIATAVTVISPDNTVLTVQSTGKDDVLRFSVGDWVEVTDDWLELNGQAGELHQVKLVDNTAKTITLQTSITGSFKPSDSTRHTRAIRWNGANIAVPVAGTAATLENGITVSFDLDASGGVFNIGDFWNFAARTVDGTVENLVKAPPRGVHHHYARLAVLSLPASTTNLPSDCRLEWPPAASEGGCDCASCVTADSHNGDTWTIQQAIGAVQAQGGGKVCLGPGTYNITKTITIKTDGSGNRPDNITISGHGLPTLMPAGATGGTMLIQGGVDIVVEGVAFAGGLAAGASPANSLIGVAISDSAFVRVEDCSFGVVTDSPPLSPAIGFDGMVIYCTIRGNFFTNVSVGLGLTTTNFGVLADATGETGNVLTQLEIEDNKMYCIDGAVYFSQERLPVVSEMRFTKNFVQSTSGFVLSGTGIDVTVEQNTFVITPAPASDKLPYDAAVVCNCSQTRIVNNEIFGGTKPLTAVAETDGGLSIGTYLWVITAVNAEGRETLATSPAVLVFTAGMASPQGSATLTWSAVPNARSYNIYRTEANQPVLLLVLNIPATASPTYTDGAADGKLGSLSLPVMQNDGIVLGRPPKYISTMYGSQVIGNRISGLTGTGILTPTGTLLEETIISQNQLLNLGGNGVAFSGVAVDIDIVGNSLASIGQAPVLGSAIGIGLLTVGNANLSGNKIENVGLTASGTVAVIGIDVLLATNLRITGNRVADIGPANSPNSLGVYVDAQPGNRLPSSLDIADNEVRRSSSVPKDVMQPAWLALAARGDSVNVRGNLLESFGNVKLGGQFNESAKITSSTVFINAQGSCIFSNNQCLQDDTAEDAPPLVVSIQAESIAAIGNFVRGPFSSDGDSMLLQTSGKNSVTVIGNFTSENISVIPDGVPAAMFPLNVVTHA